MVPARFRVLNTPNENELEEGEAGLGGGIAVLADNEDGEPGCDESVFRGSVSFALTLLALVMLLVVVMTDRFALETSAADDDDDGGGDDVAATAASIDSAVDAISFCTDCFFSLICNAAPSKGLGAKFSSGMCRIYASSSEDDGHLFNK
jgi:hypothetical protein